MRLHNSRYYSIPAYYILHLGEPWMKFHTWGNVSCTFGSRVATRPENAWKILYKYKVAMLALKFAPGLEFLTGLAKSVAFVTLVEKTREMRRAAVWKVQIVTRQHGWTQPGDAKLAGYETHYALTWFPQLLFIGREESSKTHPAQKAPLKSCLRVCAPARATSCSSPSSFSWEWKWVLWNCWL